jgi:hypothetical protein
MVLPADPNGLKAYIDCRQRQNAGDHQCAPCGHCLGAQHCRPAVRRTALKDALKGVRREKARPQRQARPLVSSDIRGVLADLVPGVPS